MTTTGTSELERDHAHASPSPDSTPDRDGPTPGHQSRSALLRKRAEATPSGLVQRAARDANGVAAGAEDAVAAASSSSGSPLPDTVMRKFESSLGADLSGVRVHTGDASAAANDAVGAKAYTVGQDIHFGAGQYDPSSPAGEHLLAHEVAHTVQQSGGATRRQHKLDVSSPGDSLESEADTAADAMVQGAPATVSGARGAVSRQLFREAAKNEQLSLKFVQQSFPLLKDVKFAEAKVSFLKLSLKGAAQFAGTIAEKEGAEAKLSIDGAARAINDAVSFSAGNEPLSFDPNGWIGLKELTLLKLGVGKGSVANFTLFKGKISQGGRALGDVTLSIAAMSWDANDLSVKLFPVAVGSEMTLLSAEGQMPIGNGYVLGSGSKVTGKVEGEVAVDLARAALIAGGELSATAGLAGLGTALASFGPPMLAMAAGGALTLGVLDVVDDLDADKVAKEAFLEVDRLGTGFEQEMKQPGHQFKPSPFWKNDPYLKGIEMASQIKSDFFARFLADPRVAKWREAHPDKGQQMQMLESVYRQWVQKDDGARAAIELQARQLKYRAKQTSFAEHFLAYAQRWRVTSGGTRVLRLFDQLWPGASWLDAARTMPMIFSNSVPKSCYDVASSLAPLSYPKDLKKWITPPTLI